MARLPSPKHADTSVVAEWQTAHRSNMERYDGFEEVAAPIFLTEPGFAPQDMESLADLLDSFQTTAVAGAVALMQTQHLSRFLGKNFSADEISELIVPKRTLARRIATGEPLSPDETDRAIRVASISVNAERIFGAAEKARLWLRRANPALGRQRPIDLMRSEAGAQAVNELLGQIDHGMFV